MRSTGSRINRLSLRSAAIVQTVFPTARYVLVGGKPEQVEKQRLLARELGVAEMVCFSGQRPLEEMPQYTALADILLSPRSGGTNTPLKLYTYLRSGKPVDSYARAVITKHGRRVCNVRAEAWQDEHTRPIAALHGHFLIKPKD